jgi:hypothetical protein
VLQGAVAQLPWLPSETGAVVVVAVVVAVPLLRLLWTQAAVVVGAQRLVQWLLRL